MPLGPGKYGANAEKLLREHGGSICLVILHGDDGPGFDVATIDPFFLHQMPALLRQVADAIERDMEQLVEEAQN